MAGDWQQTSGTRVIEEHWSTPSTNALVGMMREGRTVAFEFLRIEQRESGTFYVAQPNGRPPTDFKLANYADGELVFEGDGTDKVRRITYRRQGCMPWSRASRTGNPSSRIPLRPRRGRGAATR